MLQKGSFTFILLLLAALAQAQDSRATLTPVLNYKALQPGQQAVIAVVLDVRPGFHAQSNTPLSKYLIKYEIAFAADPNIEFGTPIYPTPTIEKYPKLGEVSVYTGKAITYIPITLKSSAPVGPLKLKADVKYQICDDEVCFAPESPKIEMETKVVPAGETLEANQPDVFKGFDPKALVPPPTTQKAENETLFGYELSRSNYPLAFAGALIVGMLFNVMPCVLPIVPLKAMGFYQAAQQNRGKSLALGAVFSAGIITTFGALAVPVVVFRSLAWGELFGNPWFSAGIVLILLLVALGTFGAFSILLPQRVYEVTPSHETYTGNFLFGILTAVLSTPCTFGMFLSLLVWAVSQPPVIGTSLVMFVGLGMAIPYLVLAAFPDLARNFPRTGPWAEIVKQMMGFLLIATAVYFGQRFLPEGLGDKGFWWVIFGVIVAACLFLIGRTLQITRTPRAMGIASGIAVVLFCGSLYGVTLLTYVPVKWIKFTSQSFEEAMKSGRPVLVEFTASWCGNCQLIEANVYTDKLTVEAIESKHVIPLKADISDGDAPGWDLLRSLHPVGAIPFTAVYSPGQTTPRTLAGIYDTDDLLKALAADLTTSSTRNPS